MLICIPLFLVWRPDIRISFALMIPMLIDGFTQKLTSYESTNFRRFVTGFLFGIGLVGIIADTTIFECVTKNEIKSAANFTAA